VQNVTTAMEDPCHTGNSRLQGEGIVPRRSWPPHPAYHHGKEIPRREKKTLNRTAAGKPAGPFHSGKGSSLNEARR